MRKLTTIIVILFLFGCASKDAKSQASRLFLKASKVFANNQNNNDSLNYAVKLLDSAIMFNKKDTRFYFTQVRIFLNLKEFPKVIEKCNKILAINKKSFFAILTKGVAFDRMHRIDSARSAYLSSLKILEETPFKTAIYRDYQRIIIYGLLNDTVDFHSKLQDFESRYKTDEEVSAYSADLKKFNKTDYISSYW